MSAPQAGEGVVSKGQFASIINVSPGRVSQMISEGKIFGEALEGEGRTAKIRVETARRQLRERTDLGQRFGNGLGTRLEGELPLADGPAEVAPRLQGADEPAPRPSPPPAPSDPVAERLKAIKLEEAERRNRQAAEEDLARAGTYVRADQSRAAMARLAAGMLNAFEGGIADLAQALATEFEIPQRELVHVLRREFRGLRAKAAAAARERAEALPATLADDAEEAAGAEEA